MRTAFYIEDGLEQIVLTPETEHEKKMLALLHGDRDISIKSGSFYECRGGYVRQRGGWNGGIYGNSERSDDESTMLVMRPRKPSPEKEPGEGGEP